MANSEYYRNRAKTLLDGITLAYGSAAEVDMERLIRATMANAYATLALRDAVAGSVIDRFRGQV